MTDDGSLFLFLSQDTLPSLFSPIASLTKYYYSGLVPRCSTSDVYGNAVSAVVSIAFSKTGSG